ncbi:hypothetical protein [Nocardiopsis salina]|uniref:hypothetical protein n=1 Tax=Nocardiopsis salina TaxID=245836 RepID=UPI00034896A9|nr:hypothetical protein [Nocardiopsis salina]
MYGFDGSSGRRERGLRHPRPIPAAFLVYAVCAVVLSLILLGMISTSVDDTVVARDLFVYVLVLAVGAPVVVWAVAAPLAALGRYLSRNLGGHRVPWTALALLVVLAVFWMANRFWAPADLDTPLGMFVLVLTGPATLVCAALRTEEEDVPQNPRGEGR